MDARDPESLLAALIRCPSVTPKEAGALAMLESVLSHLGFSVERPVFTQAGTPDVENLYARRGNDMPALMFAGHTDVVPAGSESDWSHPPFAAHVQDGWMIGRGAVDMKGGIACFLAATARYVDRNGKADGSICFLITGDEEGPSINGTDKLLQWAKERGEKWSAAIVGEPTNREKLGDTIKVGRRGSLSGRIRVIGKQGHSAYPHLADNPVEGMMDLLDALLIPSFDEGTDRFEPTRLAITSVDVGNSATNVIAQEALAAFNIRFCDLWDGEAIQREIERRLAVAAANGKYRSGRSAPLRYEVEWIGRVSPVFLTRDEQLINTLSAACEKTCGIRPALTTGGGTSDARFIKDYCPVVEFGLTGQTMHQVNERVELADLETLTRVYLTFLEDWFAHANRV